MTEQNPVEIPAWIRNRFPADHRSAVDYLTRHIDEGMRRDIVSADYAQDVEKHFSALTPLWSGES